MLVIWTRLLSLNAIVNFRSSPVQLKILPYPSSSLWLIEYGSGGSPVVPPSAPPVIPTPVVAVLVVAVLVVAVLVVAVLVVAVLVVAVLVVAVDVVAVLVVAVEVVAVLVVAVEVVAVLVVAVDADEPLDVPHSPTNTISPSTIVATHGCPATN